MQAVNQHLTVRITPISLHQFSEWETEEFSMAGINLNAPLMLVHPPDLGFIRYPGRVWCYTMYESTQVPEDWVKNINRFCERLLVPSAFCAEVFETCGVVVPIHVIPGGVDSHEFAPIKDIPDRPYTFMVLGDRGSRKGSDIVYKALWDEFGDSNAVRLVVKVRDAEANMEMFDVQKEHRIDPRISFWKKEVGSLAEVMQVADCFVFPSRGEGYGLPPREAASCGLPVIATNWSGLSDNIEKWALPVGYKPHKSVLGGSWAEPSLADVRKHMRWCFENPFEARGFGLSASAWLKKNETWEKSAQMLVKLFEENLP
jgi:hypothetical protein